LHPRSSKITLTKEKERRKRKREEEKRKKAMGAIIVFKMATLEIVFGQKKKLFDRNGPFGSNVFKNPATHRKYTKGRKL